MANTPPIHLSLATELAQRHFNPLVTVTRIRQRPAHEGQRYETWRLDRPPHTIDVKAGPPELADAYRDEADRLRYLHEHTRLPVPEPLALVADDPGFAGALLLLGRLGDASLADSGLTPRGSAVFESELARALAELHQHKADRFGEATPGAARHERWLDVYAPDALQTLEQGRPLLRSACRDVIDHVAQHLDQWLAHDTRPTLTHGDVRPQRIVLDDTHPNEPRLLGFTEPLALYADPEAELARLQQLGLARRTFFEAYAQTHPIDDGYPRRGRVYWLVTQLDLLIRDGERHAPACEQIAEDLRRLAR